MTFGYKSSKGYCSSIYNSLSTTHPRFSVNHPRPTEGLPPQPQHHVTPVGREQSLRYFSIALTNRSPFAPSFSPIPTNPTFRFFLR
ncbi:hypothetical protein QJS10_CPA05g01608 [Acorus calamus]|uniref:Uncharacterized protein n=1 Tax=Acorus calamus TaxID=4465 RepID=A0AAV9EX05_ACOCL|nr:hypothetical protein QJS10_CPA05g01608 [Acorus calamus]